MAEVTPEAMLKEVVEGGRVADPRLKVVDANHPDAIASERFRLPRVQTPRVGRPKQVLRPPYALHQFAALRPFEDYSDCPLSRCGVNATRNSARY